MFKLLTGRIMRVIDLATDHNGARGRGEPGVLLEPVVERDDVQNVKQLSLVLVNSLHLHVKHRRRIDHHVKLEVNELRQLHLVLLSPHKRRRRNHRNTQTDWGSGKKGIRTHGGQIARRVENCSRRLPV